MDIPQRNRGSFSIQMVSADSHPVVGPAAEKRQVFSQPKVILSLAAFKPATFCTASSTVPLVIPPAFLPTHIPSPFSFMPGSIFPLRTLRESIDWRKQEKVRYRGRCVHGLLESKLHRRCERSKRWGEGGEKAHTQDSTIASWSIQTKYIHKSYLQCGQWRKSMHCICREGLSSQVSSFRHPARLTAAVEA